jgi:dTDP-L-rhamnose 4-epimerase
MNCLITGGAGFIGSHTADLLSQQGHNVRILDSLEPPVHPQRKKPAYISNDFEFIQGSVCDRPTLRKALSDMEVVFHLAAYQDYLTDFSKFAQVNDVGTALLYEIIINERLPGRKVVVASLRPFMESANTHAPSMAFSTLLPAPFPTSPEETGTSGARSVAAPSDLCQPMNPWSIRIINTPFQSTVRNYML